MIDCRKALQVFRGIQAEAVQLRCTNHVGAPKSPSIVVPGIPSMEASMGAHSATDAIGTVLAALVAVYGFRVSNRDAARMGVPEHALHSAVEAGKARIERTFPLTGTTTYIIYA